MTPADVDHQEEDKTFTYLKVAGNLATRSAVHYLERFISEEGHQPEHRRIAAMWALKPAASRHPDLVRIKLLLCDFGIHAYKMLNSTVLLSFPCSSETNHENVSNCYERALYTMSGNIKKAVISSKMRNHYKLEQWNAT